jgi:uncharacterized membrane protein
MSKWKTKNKHIGQIARTVYFCILFAVTFARIFDNSFWGDECFTIRLAKLSLSDMLYATAVDVHPPLYYILVQIGYRLLGNHGYVYHLVSVIPLLITLVLCETVMRKRYGASVSVLFATFSTLLPAAQSYNVEARMYSWTALFVLLAFLAVDRILQRDAWHQYLLFALFSICAAYSHYYALVAVACIYAFLLVRSVFFARKTIAKTIMICVLSGAAYLPWLLKFLLSFQRTAESWWLEQIPNVRDCGRFLFGNDVLAVVWVLVALAVLCNIGKSVKKWERLWFAAGLCAVLGLFLIGEAASYLIRPLFITRYMYDVAAVAWLMLAVGIDRCARVFLQKKEAVICLLVSAVCVAVFLPGYADTVREERRQDAATTAFLEAVSIPEDALILTNSGPHAWTILEYYYPGTRIGETYDMTASLVENQEDCTIVSTCEFSEGELEKMRAAGFVPELYYVGEVGINTTLFVYEIDHEGN